MGYGKLPVNVERKEDCKENGSKVQEKVKAQRKREKELYPLRINERTTILVTADKRNEEYRQVYLKRINQEMERSLVGTAAKRYELIHKLTYERLDETKDLTLKEAAQVLGVSKESVMKYRKHVLYGKGA